MTGAMLRSKYPYYFNRDRHEDPFHDSAGSISIPTSSLAARKAAVEGTFQSDDRMPASVHAELVAGFAALSAVEPRDWHPGSGERMLDLVPTGTARSQLAQARLWGGGGVVVVVLVAAAAV